MSPSDTLKLFVEGGLQTREFLRLVVERNELSDLLGQFPAPQFAKQHATALEFFLDARCEDPYSVHDAKRHAQAVLTEMGVESRLDQAELPLMATIGRLQPKWVEVPIEMMKKFVSDAGSRKGKELDSCVREAIAKHFRCMTKKPSWIQSPQWQYNDRGEPMVFVAQTALAGLYHDESVIYVFVDPVERTAKTVIQSS
jgi:hypothetical protein